MRVWPFRQSPEDIDADKLLSALTQISRQPQFFGEGRIPDTLEGRFELMTLHASLALIRLQDDEVAMPMAQVFTDKLFRHFDAGLREAGVGDLTVPKKMRKMASSFYGRMEAYGLALVDQDAGALEEAIARNIVEGPFAGALAKYATATAVQQEAAPIDAMMRLDGWAPAPA